MMPELTNMSIWELAGRHTIAKAHKHYILCAGIENEVNTRSNEEKQLINKLIFWKPVGDVSARLQINNS